MKSLDKREVILRKVEEMKRGGFKATAIKVELEAEFDRGYDDVFDEEGACYDFIMERLEGIGLAKRGDEHTVGHDRRYDTIWYPSGPMVYAEFYDDHSVDSEFTFTILIDNPENVFLLPKVAQVFKQLGEEIGNDIGTWKAGMHTAILNDAKGEYPTHNETDVDWQRFNNFQRSMTLFLPALYFLASGSQTSRSLEYRQPRIACKNTQIPGSSYYDNPKYSAIYYSGGALEYRIFETCYENPDTILDNLVVIANTLRYWRKKYRPSGLAKFANEVRFGIRDGETLDRFYQTTQHIDLLNAGLRKLKPAYYSVKQIKAQRNFATDKRKINNRINEYTKAALKQYAQYKASKQWDAKVYAKRVESEFLERYAYGHETELQNIDMEAKAAEILEDAKRHYMGNSRVNILSPEEYVQNYISAHTVDEGKFVLAEPTEETVPSTNATMPRALQDLASYVEEMHGTQSIIWRHV